MSDPTLDKIAELRARIGHLIEMQKKYSEALEGSHKLIELYQTKVSTLEGVSNCYVDIIKSTRGLAHALGVRVLSRLDYTDKAAQELEISGLFTQFIKKLDEIIDSEGT